MKKALLARQFVFSAFESLFATSEIKLTGYFLSLQILSLVLF